MIDSAFLDCSPLRSSPSQLTEKRVEVRHCVVVTERSRSIEVNEVIRKSLIFKYIMFYCILMSNDVI